MDGRRAIARVWTPAHRVSTFRSALRESSALAPLGERVARRGVFISRGETGEGVQAQRAYPTASINNTKLSTFCTNKSGLKVYTVGGPQNRVSHRLKLRVGRRLAKLARFNNLSRRGCRGTCPSIGISSFHPFDPLTRPAPAGESAGCGPPS